MSTTIIIESIPQGIFRNMENSNSGSTDTPLMMNVDSFDTMDTIETILDETMAVQDIAVLAQKKGLFKRFRSQSTKSIKKEGAKEQQKSSRRRLMGRLSFGSRRSMPKLVVVETQQEQPKMLASSYSVDSEASPVHQDEESAEVKESEVLETTTATEDVVEAVSPAEEIAETLSHTEEIVETVTPEVPDDASTDDVTTANETLHEIVDLQEEAVEEVPEIKMASPVELQENTVVEDKDEVIVQAVSIHSDDLVLTMEFDEEEVETSSEEFVEEIMPEKAPYHQDSADYVGLALMGFFVTLLASPIFQS